MNVFISRRLIYELYALYTLYQRSDIRFREEETKTNQKQKQSSDLSQTKVDKLSLTFGEIRTFFIGQSTILFKNSYYCYCCYKGRAHQKCFFMFCFQFEIENKMKLVTK